MSKKILILDIETTGFLKSNGKIVEIGIVSLNIENGEITPIFNEIIKEPHYNVYKSANSWIFNNSTLTPSAVSAGKSLESVRVELQRLFNSDEYLGITAYNKVFDFGFLQDRQFTFKNILDCPMILCTKICQIPHKINTYSKQRKGYKWPSVEEAYKYFFPNEADKYVEEHRGLADAKDEAKIVYELIKLGEYKF